MSEAADVILAGIPRSGSTLTCFLLNRCPDVVALHEPMAIDKIAAEYGGDALPRGIKVYFEATRHKLKETGWASSKAVDGRIPDNPMADHPAEEKLRHSIVSQQEVYFGHKDLSGPFTLAIKHNGGFVAALDRLSLVFPCYGIVRNPLAVLLSWNSIAFPAREGFVPQAQNLDAALDAALNRIVDRYNRQLYLLDWFFARLMRTLREEHIVRYEDTVASGGRSLKVVAPSAAALDEPLQSRNRNTLYDPALLEILGASLLRTDGAYWQFYTRDSVAELLEAQ